MSTTGTLILGEPSARIGSYGLVRLLGSGSMGQVYEARHLKLDRRVAIKMLRPERAHDAGLVQRFFQEARTVNRINHPHIVAIQDFVEERDEAGNPRAYCVMEYLEGHTLAEVLTEGPLPLSRFFTIFDQVCQALAAAHEVGVVHRDLKPDNIFIGKDAAGEDFVKVLDFGVAKLVSPDPGMHLGRTHDGAIIGTPRYMAPEQAASLEIDFRTDVYGFGTMMYEALVGRPPFEDESFGPLMAKIITQPPEPPGSLTLSGEAIPPALEQLVMRCLEKDPSQRPESIAEVRSALSTSRMSPTNRTRRVSGTLFASAALMGVAAIALLVRPAIEAGSADAGNDGPMPVQASPAPEESAPTELRLTLVTDEGEDAVNSDAESTPAEAAAAKGEPPAANLKQSGRRRAPDAARTSRDAVLNPFAN